MTPRTPEGTEETTISTTPLFSSRLLSELYAERGASLFWDEAHAKQMLQLARRSREEGFDPQDFRAGEIEQIIEEGRLNAATGERRTASDYLLSDALLRYLHHLRFGKYNPSKINRGSAFVDKADAAGLKADMARVLAAPNLAEEVNALLPHPLFYENLKRAYGRYLAIADRGGCDEIPMGANLSPGAVDPRVPAIRERLAVIDGFEDAGSADSEIYGENLAKAVKEFQQRSGLSADGVIGPRTIGALNRPIDDRLAKIRANLERMRWLYNDLPSDYLFVDLTDFELHLIRGNEEVWSTKVIVGTTKNQTPMFRDEMEYLVFNPTWTMPRSIQKKMRGVSKKYQVQDRRTGRRVSGANVGDYKRYRVVQPAGPKNALGRVKFIFPNGHAIYLHDTPSKHLFSRASRAYSHGCVRVKDPLTLARQVLNQPKWDETEVQRMVARGRTRHVKLDEHLPVLLYYLTAVADEHGRVSFRRDLYDRDKPLLAMMDKPAHEDRIAFPAPAPGPEPVSKPEQIADRESGEADDQSVTGARAAPGAEIPGDASNAAQSAAVTANDQQATADPSPREVQGSSVEREPRVYANPTVDPRGGAQALSADKVGEERAGIPIPQQEPLPGGYPGISSDDVQSQAKSTRRNGGLPGGGALDAVREEVARASPAVKLSVPRSLSVSGIAVRSEVE